MNATANQKNYKIIAVVISLCLIAVWALLGTGASLAWFSDTTPEINNIFHFADFNLAVSHRLTDGSWETVDSQTKIFDEQAKYEPGYVQVVYLKVENKGGQPFRFHTAVNVNGCILATNVFGQQFNLQEYLRFGVTITDTPEKMKNSIPDRETAVAIADLPLHRYDTDTVVLQPGKEAYIALVVRMPIEVGNIANYRGDIEPKVELGITVMAEQLAD